MVENRRPLGSVPLAPKQIERRPSQNDRIHPGQLQGNKVKAGFESDSDVDSTFGKGYGTSLDQNLNYFGSASFDGAGSRELGTRSAAASCLVPTSSTSALNWKVMNTHDFRILESDAAIGAHTEISDDLLGFKMKATRNVPKRNERGKQGRLRCGYANTVLNMPWSAPSMMEGYDYDSTNNVSKFDVVARIRPLNDLEISSGAEACMDIVQQEQDGNLLRVFRKSSRERQPPEKDVSPLVQNNFSFRSCIAPDEGQDVVFDKCGLPKLIDDALDGINVTIFAVRLFQKILRKLYDFRCYNEPIRCTVWTNWIGENIHNSW